MIFDETKEDMPTTQDFEDSAEFETEINIPEANTEVMAKEIITPVSAATPFPGPVGMNVNPETLEKLEQVELPESVEQRIEQFTPSDSLLARPAEEDTSLLERG